jgi:inositol-phosphate phosphatase/L-galactose 1-phosphate phosphatase/histidinol-phosphatase
MTDIPALFTSRADELVAFAHQLAELARAEIRPHFRTGFDVISKADASPVTIADRNAEAAMRKAIETQYPDHGIFGEEFGPVRSDAAWQWILDPIDGTKSFVSGLPIFGTLIALTFENRPVLGVIDQPIMADRWIGAAGRPTEFNGKPARTNAQRGLNDAVLMTTYVDSFSEAELAAFTKLRKACRINRMSGDCIAYGMLASGFADIAMDGRMQPYDYAALVPVITGAGGVITDWEGQPLDMRGRSRALAAANPALHRAAMDYLSGV